MRTSIIRTSMALIPLVFAAGAAAAAAAATQPLSRAEAIKQALDQINKELADRGGSYEKWGQGIKPYRDDLARLLASGAKWPWPAKHNFAFQGREVDLIQRDTFDNDPPDKRPFEFILDTHRKLKEQGIDLIFAPLPDKLSIYPDYLSEKAPADRRVCPAVHHLMKKLLENDVECVDLFPAFYACRKANEDKPLYYDRDSHWRNIAAQIAAEGIAQRLLRYDFVQKALAEGNRYSTRPERRADKPDDLLVVIDARGGRYKDAPDSPILITGDSNLMYNMGATGGHCPAHIGRHIGLPLAFAPNTVPSQHDGKLAGKKVVIWANISRSLVGLSFPRK